MKTKQLLTILDNKRQYDGMSYGDMANASEIGCTRMTFRRMFLVGDSRLSTFVDACEALGVEIRLEEKRNDESWTTDIHTEP